MSDSLGTPMDKAKAAMVAAEEVYATIGNVTKFGDYDHLVSLVNYNLRLVELEQRERQNDLLGQIVATLKDANEMISVPLGQIVMALRDANGLVPVPFPRGGGR